MKRLSIFMLVAALAMAQSALADTFYGTATANLLVGNAHVGCSPNYYTDYDMEVTDVSSLTHNLGALLSEPYLEVFCIEDQDAAWSRTYDLYDLTDDAALGSDVGGAVQRLIAAAMVTDQSWAPLQETQFTTETAARDNVDPTVVGLQMAIWDAVGLDYGSPSNSYTSTRDALKDYVLANSSLAGVESIAFVDAETQNFAGVILGNGQGITAVPDPSTLVHLVGLSMMGLGYIGWRHRRRDRS